MLLLAQCLPYTILFCKSDLNIVPYLPVFPPEKGRFPTDDTELLDAGTSERQVLSHDRNLNYGAISHLSITQNIFYIVKETHVQASPKATPHEC